MVTLNPDGTLTFIAHAADAETVELVGTFSGWHDDRLPMQPEPDSDAWTITIDPGAGEYLFRYCVDGARWIVDLAAHGVRRAADGDWRSRAWCPAFGLNPLTRAA